MRPATTAALSFLAIVAACASIAVMPEPPEGAALFSQNCASCHGADARGGTALVGGKHPPDLTRLSARNGGEFPLTRVLSQIDGYGRGSLPAEAMPEFGDLLTGETVPVEDDGELTPTPRPLAALAVYLESIQQP
jgi:mono/diheme cytochrome c family protein